MQALNTDDWLSRINLFLCLRNRVVHQTTKLSSMISVFFKARNYRKSGNKLDEHGTITTFEGCWILLKLKCQWDCTTQHWPRLLWPGQSLDGQFVLLSDHLLFWLSSLSLGNENKSGFNYHSPEVQIVLTSIHVLHCSLSRQASRSTLTSLYILPTRSTNFNILRRKEFIIKYRQQEN